MNDLPPPWIEDLWLTGCAGKDAYHSQSAALAHLEWMLRHGLRPYRQLHAYRCRFNAQHWHIGGWDEHERRLRNNQVVRRAPRRAVRR